MPQKQQQKKQKGLPLRVKKSATKVARYFGTERRFRVKERVLRRMLKSNGAPEAARWAKQHDGMSAVTNIVRRGCDEHGKPVTKLAMLANAALRS
jgi:hypothetical protein